MIFLTVGTAMFDPLVKVIDRLVGEGVIKERVVAQIGVVATKVAEVESIVVVRG